MMTLTATHPLRGVAVVRRPAAVRFVWLLLGATLVALLLVASVGLGARDVTGWDVVQGLRGEVGTLAQAAVAARIPRSVMAVLIGAMLAVAGGSMQAVTRNPLADPGLLGVSLGASLAVVIGMAVFSISAPGAFIAVAIAGAAATSTLVFVIGSLGYGGATPLKLALAGAATAAAASSLVSAILLPRVGIVSSFQHWQVGGVGGATWDRIGLVAPFAGFGLALSFALTRGLNALALGDEVATALGERTGRTRLLGWTAAVVLAGAATAVAGPIAFVGLVVPHAVRLLLGPDYRWVLPASAVFGAALLLACDIVGRVIARPQEIEVGIVVALLGAPFFVWLVRRQKVRTL